MQQLAGAVLGLSLGTFPPSCDQISTNVHPSRHKEYAIGGDVELHTGGQRGARSCNCTNGGRRNMGGRKQNGHRRVCRGCYKTVAGATSSGASSVRHVDVHIWFDCLTETATDTLT